MLSWIEHEKGFITSEPDYFLLHKILLTDDDANINPYATFNELKLVFSENPTYHKADPDSEEDSVSLEKAEAQKAVCIVSNVLVFSVLYAPA